MLRVAPGVKVYLACQPVDMRRGFDGLSADVARALAADPYSGGSPCQPTGSRSTTNWCAGCGSDTYRAEAGGANCFSSSDISCASKRLLPSAVASKRKTFTGVLI
jgi:hypothetical protein